MPLFAFSLFFLFFHAYFLSSLSASAQTADPSVTVFVNDTSKWSYRGNWTLIHVLEGFQDNWIVPTLSGTDETSVTISFAGTAVVLFGTVVNGTQGQPMNVSVTLDTQAAEVPTYTPTAAITAAGVDNNNQIFSKGALSYQVHTIKLTVTGNTPFYLRGVLYNPQAPATPSSASIPVGQSPTQTAANDTSSSASNDTPKLAGAIGGGVGALLVVGIIIFIMMRRVRQIEKNEKKLQAIPFLANTGPNRSQAGAGAYTQMGPVRSPPRTNPVSSTTAVEEKVRIKDQSVTAASSSRSFTRTHKSQPSPAASLISIPSEFQHGTTVVPAGTAVASSYIGTSPLPQVGLPSEHPPVPPIPTDVKYRTRSMKRRDKQEREARNADPMTPSSGLGLFSNDSVNTLGSTGSALSRPLPIVPGTRSSAPSYSFPPEKVGLSPPPSARPRSGSTSKREKRPLPELNPLPPSR